LLAKPATTLRLSYSAHARCPAPDEQPAPPLLRGLSQAALGAERLTRPSERGPSARLTGAEERDPGHGGRAAQLRGAKNAAHQKAVKAWNGERPESEVFTAEILPGLRDIPLSALADATGLSEHYCSLIRLGKRVPHPRHWEKLRTITDHKLPRSTLA
jgi:hypothetical protein